MPSVSFAAPFTPQTSARSAPAGPPVRFVAVLVLVSGLTLGCRSDAQNETASAHAEIPKPAPVVLRDWAVPEAGPGGRSYPQETRAAMKRALDGKPEGYEPRTHHKNDDDSPKFTNRLVMETSPYLGQHAHNPVDFYPWGDEAFAAARELDRPILLSVGYSTCHWCHVMEKESFEDLEIATYLNANFISIKVDREERPDVDNVYMDAVRMLTNRGGWPMTVVMTPDGKPFFGGTYFPARDGQRGSRRGFFSIIQELATQYRDEKDEVVSKAAELSQKMAAAARPRAPGDVPGAKQLFDTTGVAIARGFDREWGGFGGAPKFPRPSILEFLSRHHRRTGDAHLLDMIVKTLEAMADGGMYDHVGGGFHRYSVDRRWLVPHFEKMLYDNAQLVTAYLDGFQITGREDFARVARETLDYVALEMTNREGGFYSATDADSPVPGGHYEEGLFFTWTPDELRELLGADRARVVEAYYGVTARGNFEGRSILHTWREPQVVADDVDLTLEDLTAEIAAARAILYEAREKRLPPIKDRKVLTAWNGLMISAFARGASVLREDKYRLSARRAAQFVLANLVTDGVLRRSFMDGQARHAAVLDDYTFLAAGLLDLYEVDPDRRWLDTAIRLHSVLTERFEDKQNGGFFLTAADAEKLLVREKPDYDGARPSGNSVALGNLVRLLEYTTDEKYRAQAERLLRAFSANLERGSLGIPRMLAGYEAYEDLTKEIIFVKPSPDADVSLFQDRLAKRYLPNRIVLTVTEGDQAEELAKTVPIVGEKNAREGKVTAYVCEQRVCKFPTTDPEHFAKQLESVAPYGGG